MYYQHLDKICYKTESYSLIWEYNELNYSQYMYIYNHMSSHSYL